jgi:hypothetical protein
MNRELDRTFACRLTAQPDGSSIERTSPRKPYLPAVEDRP